MSKQGFLNGELLDGKYRIERLLGQGGMGSVYRATHLGTTRTVAIKVIHPQFSSDPEFVARFRREAEAAGRLRHPNVVDVTDFGFAQIRFGRVAYLVMEYLDGCTLAEVLAEEQRLPVDWAVDILEQVCMAVEEAHRLGIIHRDLKPDNIWLEPNRRGGYTIKVLDFGLVKLDVATLPDHDDARPPAGPAPTPGALSISATLIREETAQANAAPDLALSEPPTMIQPAPAEEAATRMQKAAKTGAQDAPETAAAAGLTRVGSILGTPLYMSPEQCRGETLDRRSDIYSLGVIAYRMLAGQTPFAGSLDELIRLHTTGAALPLRKTNRKVPRRMARLVMMALAKDPAQRPESAAGFASALRASAEGSSMLLRHAISLYSNFFPTFLKLSLLSYLPVIAAVGLLNVSDRLFPFERLTPLQMAILGPLLILVMIAANLLAYATVTAVTVPVVMQLMVAPVRQVRVRTAFAALRRRWLIFSATTIVVMALTFVGALLFVVPGIIALLCYALYAPVVVMEGRGVRATLKRARRLMQRSWGTVLIITLLQFALPVLVWVASVDITFVFRVDEHYNPKEFQFGLDISDRSALYQLLNIFVAPLTAMMTALLYLKTRHAGGESLKDAIEQFDALEIPRSRWQARMRNRSISPTPAGSNREAQQPSASQSGERGASRQPG